jgi:23S rRNA (cytidine2498-2'-O)-methyltransferase
MARRQHRRGASRHAAPPKRPGRSGRAPTSGKVLAKASAKPQAPKAERLGFPKVTPGPPRAPAVGEWLWTTRPGAEIDLLEELTFADAATAPHPVAASLVASRARPRDELAFARQGFAVAALLDAATPAELARALVAALRKSGRPQPWALDVWVADSDESNPLAARAAELEARADLAALDAAWAQARVQTATAALTDNGLYAQACLLPGGQLALGVGPAREAQSLAPGGRLRVHVPDAAPSRAAMKLLEAFSWLDRAPEPGELCVDLGAAPGGWSWVLLERRAHVLAVDPAHLARSLQGKRGLHHLRADAFTFTPDEPVDWLLSDMAWRPLESAALLAKWARRGWARLLIANIKLPMRKKAEMLARVKEILRDGGWSNLRVRQLYHDREEVTVAGVRI